MKIKFEKTGVVKDSTKYPQEIDHYVTLKYVYYQDGEINKAKEEIGKYECWDSTKKVFIKTI